MPRDDNPLLSIIIATYNAASFLPRTIESVREQSAGLADVEVILIDGESNDNTVKIAKDSGMFTNVISEPDAGIYDAMNKGAEVARGEWLHFLNAGDAFTDAESLAAITNRLRLNRHNWAICRAVNLGGGNAPVRRIPSVPHTWWRHALGLQPHCHQATFFRRKTFHELGGHSLKYGTAGDFDLILRIGLTSEPLPIDRVCINYLGGGLSDGAWHASGEGQHRSRVDRMQLGHVGSSFDTLWVHLSQLMLRARIQLGRMRRR